MSQGRPWWRLRLAPGRGGGREKRGDAARPALPSGPGEGAAGTRHSLPGDAEGGGSSAQRLPGLGGALPLPPGAGEQIRPPRPSSPRPHDSALEQGGGDWDGSFLTGPVFAPTLDFKPLPCFLHLPFLCHPFCIIRCLEKGTETRKEGQSFTPLHSQNPQEAWEQGQGFGPKPLPSRNPHSRS